MSSQVALIGLAVMGQNLALNMLRHNIALSVYNRTQDVTHKFLMSHQKSYPGLTGSFSLKDLVASLRRPRKIILLVKAGLAVDSVLEELLPLLEKGDIIIDGGNSHFKDTQRRQKHAIDHDIHFIGMGVSGGEKGALLGPSLMPGGDERAYQEIAPLLEKIAAPTPHPCVAYMGQGGAGHYVKMVHNGIEYADMQLIAETYDLLSTHFSLSNTQIADIFDRYQNTQLQSYLIEITSKILRRKADDNQNISLLDLISDEAHTKGTGGQVVEAAIEQGLCVSTISSALDSRFLSQYKNLRKSLRLTINPSKKSLNEEQIFHLTSKALLVGKVVAYAQGLHLLAHASDFHSFQLNLAHITKIWRSGCIIRSSLLEEMMKAFEERPKAHLLNLTFFKQIIENNSEDLREIVKLGVEQGLGLKTYTSALDYLDTLAKTTPLPTRLIQAQRDFFGAHTYERTDKAGHFHTEWED